jgi:excisionase family DNA binding protein
MPDMTVTDLSATGAPLAPLDAATGLADGEGRDAALALLTYTVEQFAAALQCSPRHIWRQIDLGTVPGVLRIGRLVRIARSVADEWIRSGCPRRASR